MEPIDIPRTIDAPPMILMWQADDALPVAVGAFIGLMTNQLIVCTAIGFIAIKFYKRFRDGRPDGYALHMLYRAGIILTKAKSMPNPFRREFLP